MALETVTVVGIVFNVVSVVGVVLINKFLASSDGFKFVIALSACHFIFTALGTRVLLNFGFFTYKDAALNKVLPVALGSLGSVAFMNLNLAHNSVGFYQLSKLCCIPVTILLERFLYNKAVSRPVQLSLVPILVGVGLATVNDTQVNFVGTLFAVCAVLCTTCAQIFTSRFQGDLKCDALQLLYHTSPIIAVGMCVMVPVFDNISTLASYTWPAEILIYGIMSCFLALGVNITNYLVLGKTSPLTYQVLGHFKTVSILILGFTVFHSAANTKQIVGIILAMMGVIMYSEAKKSKSSPVITTSPGKDRRADDNKAKMVGV